MKSRWNEAEARAAVGRWREQGAGEDLAWRTYSARLLGADPALVLHGGGNTSVKTTQTDLFGEAVEVLCVKGSGWDLAAIEPAGHPAVRLAPLRRLRALDRLSDEAMVDFQRQNLMRSDAPNPSVETLLHAFIGAKFIDHTHAEAVLALADQPDAAAVLARVYGPRIGIVPYVMPGFELARAAAAAFEADPAVEGLVLVNHGIFSFGASAREAYERMIALVDTAERFIAERPAARVRRRAAPLPAASALPLLRGLLAEAAGETWPARFILDLRQDGPARAMADHPRLADLAARGVATPDHVIRTKRHPLVLPAQAANAALWRESAQASLRRFVADYGDYFARHAASAKTQLDSLPRLAAAPGLGLIGVGRSAAEAAVAADIGQSWAATTLAAEAVGRFAPLGEADTFAMEYWSLEQAKLGKGRPPPLAGQVALVTGAGGAIGAATAAAFAAEGAEVVLLDIDEKAAAAAAAAIGPRALAFACDLTKEAAVTGAFAAAAARFGGLDIVVCNAGAAVTGAMAELPRARLQASLDLNFLAHQTSAQAAIAVFRAQAMGGVLLFNVSKQAINPGPGFGAYGAAKAALLALARQYALELGAEGVRVNVVNADRIRSGLLTEAMIAERAHARGLAPQAYMAGNLLGAEVRARDVAEAFVHLARMERTTGAVLTVDGGNVAAMVR